jgi:hypothetical protein
MSANVIDKELVRRGAALMKSENAKEFHIRLKCEGKWQEFSRMRTLLEASLAAENVQFDKSTLNNIARAKWEMDHAPGSASSLPQPNQPQQPVPEPERAPSPAPPPVRPTVQEIPEPEDSGELPADADCSGKAIAESLRRMFYLIGGEEKLKQWLSGRCPGNELGEFYTKMLPRVIPNKVEETKVTRIEDDPGYSLVGPAKRIQREFARKQADLSGSQDGSQGSAGE